MARLGTLAALLVLASLSGAARADDSACAKIEDPLAYNACLASHGPRAGAVGAAPGGTETTRRAPGGEPSAGRPRLEAEKRSAAPAVDRRRGRVHMEFHLQ